MNTVRFKQLFTQGLGALTLAMCLSSCGGTDEQNVDVLFEKVTSDVTVGFVSQLCTA